MVWLFGITQTLLLNCELASTSRALSSGISPYAPGSERQNLWCRICVIFKSADGSLLIAEIFLPLIFSRFFCDFSVSSSGCPFPTGNHLVTAASTCHCHAQMCACLIPGFFTSPLYFGIFHWPLLFEQTGDISLFSATSLLLLSRLQIDFGHRPATELKTKDAS